MVNRIENEENRKRNWIKKVGNEDIKKEMNTAGKV